MLKRFFTSRTTFFLICALFLLNRFWTAWGPGYNNSDIIKWDCYGYYLYLPSIFIYDDPGLKNQVWIDTLQNRYHPTESFYQVRNGQDGMRSVKYPCGSAILWSPFFFAAHLLAEPLGYPADGLSPPYNWAVLIAGILYAFIGLWFLRKVLLHFFSDHIAAILMILITLGTNYWQMSASDTIMPHGTSFALNCVLLWLIIRWHEQPTFGRSVAMGLLLGVGVLVRPTEAFWLLVPLLWNVSSFRTLIAKFKFIGQHILKVLAFAVAFIAVLFIQLSYWKYGLGTWVSYGYEETFAIWTPFLRECMFSFKKGWFIYTPLMLFCFAGFYFVWKKRREIFWALLIFTIIHTWVIFSWECWWYASSFGQRGAIDMYAVMTIPLGFLLVALEESKRAVRISVGSLIGFCLVLNIFQVWQYNHGIMHEERMTEAYYWRIFGKTTVTEEDRALLEPNHWPWPELMESDPDLPKLVVVDDYTIDFEEGGSFTDERIVDSIACKGKRSLKISPSFEYGPQFKRNFHGESHEYQWVRLSAWVRMDTALQPGQQVPLMALGFMAHGRFLKWKAMPFDTVGYKPGEWRLLQCEMKTPISLYEDDEIQGGVWHPGRTTIYIDDFRAERFEPAEQQKK